MDVAITDEQLQVRYSRKIVRNRGHSITQGRFFCKAPNVDLEHADVGS